MKLTFIIVEITQINKEISWVKIQMPSFKLFVNINVFSFQLKTNPNPD